ncbi:MAG: flavodoxin family protein [Desulfobacterota bacterium]|nr:flavodoxin family protein [Thermodesulfobacteriota bacterium]
MKVLGIFGSPRRGGNTELLLEETLKAAEGEGAEVDRLYIVDYVITPCTECHGCDETGHCVILDDMEKIYPRLIDSDVIVLASPIFFYGVTAWVKALIDRSQALWARKYLTQDPGLGKEGRRRKGFFISVGATKGKRVFEGAILTVKYFFDTFNAEYAGELLFRGVDGKGEILKYPEALQQAFEAGRRLVRDR